MDVDGPESGTQTVFQANDYGVEVDFDELDEDEQEVCSPDLGVLRTPSVLICSYIGWLGGDGRTSPR